MKERYRNAWRKERKTGGINEGKDEGMNEGRKGRRTE